MTTVTTNTSTETQTTTKKKAIVCVCCLAFFPVLYLIGSTVMSMLG